MKATEVLVWLQKPWSRFTTEKSLVIYKDEIFFFLGGKLLIYIKYFALVSHFSRLLRIAPSLHGRFEVALKLRLKVNPPLVIISSL